MQNKFPTKIVLFSGKRKSGKDFVTDLLYERLGSSVAVVIKISAPIKSHWAKTKGLQLGELMGNGEYKEKYRRDMILWGEELRRRDHGYFCRAAIEMVEAEKRPIWLVSDVRRKTDLKWFRENYGVAVMTVRIDAKPLVRAERGWSFTKGVDDVESECDLDDVHNWDLCIPNNGFADILNNALTDIEARIRSALV